MKHACGKQQTVVRRIIVETNVKFSKESICKAQLADDDVRVVMVAKEGDLLVKEEIHKESPTTKGWLSVGEASFRRWMFMMNIVH